MELAAEMELDYEAFLLMTWSEFQWRQLGHIRRLERMWDYTRHLIASMFNSSGFAKKKTEARQVMRLSHLDRPQPIRKIDKATVKRLLNKLNNG